MKRIAAVSLFLLACSGCSTIGSLSRDSGYRWAYSGTRQDVGYWDPHPGLWDCTGMGGLVAALDLPWSFALDTAVLPVTLPLQLILGTPAPEKSYR